MACFPVLLLLALSTNPAAQPGIDQDAGHQADSAKVCSESYCTSTIMDVNPPAPRPAKPKKYRNWVSGRVLFVFAVVNAALSISAESGGFFFFIGPAVYPMALMWISLMQVSVHMAVKQLRKLGGKEDLALKRLVGVGWGLVGLGVLAWIANIVIFSSINFAFEQEAEERDRTADHYKLYLIELYAGAVPIAIGAFAFSIRARIVAARTVKTFPGKNPEDGAKKSEVTLSPFAWPVARGLVVGLGGAF
jgi:hypothetical protein